MLNYLRLFFVELDSIKIY